MKNFDFQRFKSPFSSCLPDLTLHALKINVFNLQILSLVVLRIKLGNYWMIDAVLKLVHCCSFNMLNIALKRNFFVFGFF